MMKINVLNLIYLLKINTGFRARFLLVLMILRLSLLLQSASNHLFNRSIESPGMKINGKIPSNHQVSRSFRSSILYKY